MISLDMQKKIGILGGSFDPIHYGHINIAQNAYEEYHLDEVWFIPAGHSPNKDEKDMTPAYMRAEMVELAIADYPHFRMSDIELTAEGTTYTYLTIEKLHNLYPAYRFYFIMGADSLDYFEHWVHPEKICKNAVILAAVRDSMDILQIQTKIAQLKAMFFAQIFPIHAPKISVSSTDLRIMVQNGMPDIPYLPQAAVDYIKENRLYGYLPQDLTARNGDLDGTK